MKNIFKSLILIGGLWATFAQPAVGQPQVAQRYERWSRQQANTAGQALHFSSWYYLGPTLQKVQGLGLTCNHQETVVARLFNSGAVEAARNAGIAGIPKERAPILFAWGDCKPSGNLQCSVNFSQESLTCAEVRRPKTHTMLSTDITFVVMARWFTPNKARYALATALPSNGSLGVSFQSSIRPGHEVLPPANARDMAFLGVVKGQVNLPITNNTGTWGQKEYEAFDRIARNFILERWPDTLQPVSPLSFPAQVI